MKETYFYPNEVDVWMQDGKRVAALKPNWREIRKKNEEIHAHVAPTPAKGE